MNPSAGGVPIPLERAFERMGLDTPAVPLEETLRDVNGGRGVLQDFRPLTESLEWELSSLHWAKAGVLPFVQNEVPFAINNTGRLSESAAAVLFASCLERPPGERIAVLELGAGSGLFARYFLESFAALCKQEGRDFHERLLYCVSDRSPRTVEQWQERGLFDDWGSRVLPVAGDALAPGTLAPAPLRAVFANYLLDVLPSTVVRRTSAGLEELRVRTLLTSDRALIPQYTRLRPEQITALAASEDPVERARLGPLISLLELDAAYQSCAEPPPYTEEALAGVDEGQAVPLSYGAIQCLEACLRLLDAGGFVLFNDYGSANAQQSRSHAASQRFGPTTAAGINFPLLERHFQNGGRRLFTPEGDETQVLHSRLLADPGVPGTIETFRNRFSAQARLHFEGPLEEARRHAQAGRKSEALASYKLAMTRSPRDWAIVGEGAEFVGLQLSDYQAGVALARAAVALNPWYSCWIWNVLGDCLFCLERYSDAHEAYLQAQRLDPFDVRTNLNLAYTLTHYGAHQQALQAIAAGLAYDYQGEYRERLLEKQREILTALTARWRAEQQRLAKHVVGI